MDFKKVSVILNCRSLIEIGEGEEKRTGFNSFESQISLTIPGYGVIQLSGDPRADKKSSYDSACLLMLYELQRLGKLKIGLQSSHP